MMQIILLLYVLFIARLGVSSNRKEKEKAKLHK
jgi:hypothetical protein